MAITFKRADSFITLNYVNTNIGGGRFLNNRQFENYSTNIRC